MDIQIHSVHFDADSKLRELIIDKVKKLQHYSEKIESIDVYLKLENNHQKIKDKVVEIKLCLPGQKLFCMNKAKSFEKAFHDALEAAGDILIKKKSSTIEK